MTELLSIIEIKKYNLEHRQLWDSFVENAKNSHFMFYRNYMDYHSDRFIDNSLLFYKKDKLIAILPANISNGIVYSHQGLTFGGIISDIKMSTDTMLEIFTELVKYLKLVNVKKIIYKSIPHIYHNYPAEEDLYALFRFNATLVRRDVSCSIFLDRNRIGYSDLRKRSIKKAIKNGVYITEENNFKDFWIVLENVLMNGHSTKPVHSYEEIQHLKNTFPEYIKLFVAKNERNDILAGTVLFITNNVIHAQYLASSADGKMVGALDFVIDHILNNKLNQSMIFDFGTSNEDNGKFLNSGLISQKEGFGARAIVHDFYELEL